MDGGGQSHCHVLLVDDTAASAGFMGQLFATAGAQFSLSVVAGLTDALAFLHGRQADLILLDLRRPDSDGFEALGRLISQAPDVPVVVLAESDNRALEQRALQQGAQDYVVLTAFNAWTLVRIAGRAIERSQAVQILRGKAEHLRLLVSELPIAIWSTNQDLRFTMVEGAGFRQQGLEPRELIGTSFADYTRGAHAAEYAGRALAGESLHYELEREGRTLDVHHEPLRDTKGAIIGTVGLSVDITERKRTEDALRQSEQEQLRLVRQMERERALLTDAQAVAKMGSWETDRSSSAISWSEEMHRIFETDPRRFHPTHRDFLAFTHPDDRARVAAAFEASFEDSSARTIEHRLVMRDGRVKIVEERWRVFPREDGRGTRALGTCHDITERKQSEAQLHAVSTRMNDIREHERARMAREVHDTLGQALTALKMDVAEVGRRVASADAAAIQERLTEMSALIDASVDDVRRVAAELRPVILDDLGIVDAVKAYLEDVGRRAHVRCVLTTDLSDLQMADDRATALFRILQEALTNVVRHAAAARVDVLLAADAETLRLVVHDDGCGIAAPAERNPRTLGLLGMRDRALLLGGDVTVTGGPGEGTTVTAHVPLAQGPPA